MNGLGWLLAYMMVGMVWALYEYDEEDTSGMVFLFLFYWPLPVAGLTAIWLSRRIVYGVDRLFELIGGEE